MFFSTLAFVFGIVTVVATAWTAQCVVIFMLNIRALIDIFKVPSRIYILYRLSGTHHKLWPTASYHVSHIFLLLVM